MFLKKLNKYIYKFLQKFLKAKNTTTNVLKLRFQNMYKKLFPFLILK